MLIHGWGLSYTIWQKLVPLLEPHFQLILVELPGMGNTELRAANKPYYETCAEALEELRLSLGIEQWAILSYSIGTRTSEIYLRDYPERVTRALFLCPNFLLKSWQICLHIVNWLNLKNVQLANWFFSDWRLFGILQFLAFNFRKTDDARLWMDEIELQSLENLKNMLLELPDKGRSPFNLPETSQVPTLFVWGLQDLLTARPFRPRPNDVFIPGNHAAPLYVPESIASIAVAFFQEEQAVYKSPYLILTD
ncbi:MAG TPA: alpha/beta hydrolase [Ktedonobacteraceae bacterium]|nr:alpha/beta hydrolase [Ktedonobacteraceae bacterium]